MITDEDLFPAAAFEEPEAKKKKKQSLLGLPILLYLLLIIVLATTHTDYLLWPHFNHIPIQREHAAELGNMPTNQASKQKHVIIINEL